MNKKYCCKCVNCVDEADLMFYSSLHFRNSDEIIYHGRDICIAKKEVSYSYNSNFFKKNKTKHIIVDDPHILNKNNDCEYFSYNLFWRILRLFKMG